MSGYFFSRKPQEVNEVSSNFRRIRTKIPCPGTQDTLERLDKIESRSMHGQLPLVWEKAENFNIFDSSGNKWIDLTSSIFIANVGHSNKRVSSAIKSTLNNPLYSCYAYGNEIRASYIEKLLEFAGDPFEKAFLLSAGTEATEAAFKLMRMNGQKNKKRELGILCIENNWHGRTLGAQMMSSNKGQSLWIGEKDKHIHHIPFPYPWDVGDVSGERFFLQGLSILKEKGVDPESDICGIMLETFQGWGAVFYPESFVQSIRYWSKKNNILLAFDEMQSGFGRTGKKFGYEHYAVEPDLMCLGKGMGGGVPLSGVLGKKEVLDLPDVGNMSSTHSGNPLVCAAGSAVIDELIENNLIEETYKKGKILFQELEKLKSKHSDKVSFISGKGLIAAIIFKNDFKNGKVAEYVSRVCEEAMRRGVLVVHTGRESIKLGPPLTIPIEALLEGINVIDNCLDDLS